MYWGLGTGGGTIVGGYVSHVFGFRSTFQGFAVVTGVVLAVFLATQFISKYSNFPKEDGNEEVADDAENDDEMLLSSQELDKNSPSDSDISADTWKSPHADAQNLFQPAQVARPADDSEEPTKPNRAEMEWPEKEDLSDNTNRLIH